MTDFNPTEFRAHLFKRNPDAAFLNDDQIWAIRKKFNDEEYAAIISPIETRSETLVARLRHQVWMESYLKMFKRVGWFYFPLVRLENFARNKFARAKEKYWKFKSFWGVLK